MKHSDVIREWCWSVWRWIGWFLPTQRLIGSVSIRCVKIHKVLLCPFYLQASIRARGLMLQECRKDWIREWQHSCVFSVWNNCTKSYLGHRFRHFIGHIFATCPKHLMICHRHSGMCEGGSMFQTKILCNRQCFCSKSVCEVYDHLGLRLDLYFLSSGHHLKIFDLQYWKLEVWSY